MLYQETETNNIFFKKEKYLIFDDILDDISIKNLHKDFLLLPWNFAGNLVSLDDYTIEKYKNNTNVKNYIKLVCDFYDNDKKYENSFLSDFILDNFLRKINIKNVRLYRSKTNLQTQFTENKPHFYNSPHIDFKNTPHYVLIYYVNDSDGDTLLFDENENIICSVKPKAGRFLFFNGNILHAGSNPYKSDYRILVNYNFSI